MEHNPRIINKVKSIAAAWGWTVQNIQITDSQVAYESGAVGWTTEFGTFVNKTISIKRTTYASITCQRDMEDPKYKDWVALEREYNELEAKSFFTPEEQRELDELKEKIGKKWVRDIVGPSLLFTATFVALSINSEPNPAYMIPIIFFVAIAVVGGVFLKEKGVQNKLPQDKQYKALCKGKSA